MTLPFSASLHKCHLTSCSGFVDRYCVYRSNKRCAEYDDGLYIEISGSKYNTTKKVVNQYFAHTYNTSFASTGCLVNIFDGFLNFSQFDHVTWKNLTWKNETVIIVTNTTALLDCYYNDSNDFFFLVSFGLSQKNVSAFIYGLFVPLMMLILLTFGSLIMIFVHLQYNCVLRREWQKSLSVPMEERY